MSIDTKFPYKIYSVQNFPEGIKFEVCLKCSNQDETITTNFVLNQQNCKIDDDCPVPKSKVNKAGSCYGTLERKDGSDNS